jgi:sn-glycerol 3-phosphate transport system permease protein
MRRLPSLGQIFSTLTKLLLIVIFVFPFFWMATTSLQTLRETMSYPPKLFPDVPQWENYKLAWESGPFLMYLRNSVVVTASVIVLQMLTMIPAAYAFAKYSFFGKGLLFGCVLLAFMIPVQVTFLPIYLMMADFGLIRTLWPQIIPFMHNAFGVFLLRQYFMQVPEELIESARLDNASEWSILARIMVPMAKPALATIALLSFVGHWNDYFWPLIMTDTIDVRPLTIGIAMLKTTESVNNWHIIMAGNVILVIPILLVYSVFSQRILNSLAYTGIK